jgi:hypothetical protein
MALQAWAIWISEIAMGGVFLGVFIGLLIQIRSIQRSKYLINLQIFSLTSKKLISDFQILYF